MELIIILLYIFFTGCIFTCWLWNSKDHPGVKILNVIFGFITGWYMTPYLIGQALIKILNSK